MYTSVFESYVARSLCRAAVYAMFRKRSFSRLKVTEEMADTLI